MQGIEKLLGPETLNELLPRQNVESFFESFYFGEEPAYDLSLGFGGISGDLLRLELLLKARPGQCLACNLTWGLPEVMAKHPMLDLAGMIKRLEEKLAVNVASWELGPTEERGADLHVIPILVRLAK